MIGLTSERVSETELKASGADFVVDNLSEVMVVLRQHGSKEDQANQSN